MFLFQERKRVMKQAKPENPVSIAETIILMQESLMPEGLSLATLASHGQSVVNKVKTKLIKPKFNVGDIVYLSAFVIDFNWKLANYVGRPFIIVQLPVDTQKFKTYTLRLLDDPSNEECWEDLAFHESFLQRRT
jgi:hypothetical protein